MESLKLKGGVGMKITLVIAMLLMTSIFAFALASADSIGSVTSADVGAEISSIDIESQLVAETDAEKDNYRSFPAEIIWGNGWATSGKSGYLAQIAVVSKILVNADDVNEQTQKSKGFLALNRKDKYRIGGSSNPETDSAIIYTVYAARGNEEIGTLSLSNTGSYEGNFQLWSGELKFNSGESYELHLATEKRPMRKAYASAKIESRSKADVSIGKDSASEDSAVKVESKSGLRSFFGKLFSRN